MENNNVLLVDGTALLGGLPQALPTDPLTQPLETRNTSLASDSNPSASRNQLSTELDYSELLNEGEEDQQPFSDPTSSPSAAPVTNAYSFSTPARVSLSSVDPIIGKADNQALVNSTEVAFSVEDVELNESFSSLYDSDWVLQRKFGDFDGQNDAQLSVKDTEGKVVGTFSLTGNGYGEVFQNDEYEYIFFSGIDETTSVEVSALSNIRFDDFVGSSLKIETEGSIAAGDIILLDDFDSLGLSLRSGLNEAPSSSANSTYKITNLDTLAGRGFRNVYDINNSGQIVGDSWQF